MAWFDQVLQPKDTKSTVRSVLGLFTLTCIAIAWMVNQLVISSQMSSHGQKAVQDAGFAIHTIDASLAKEQLNIHIRAQVAGQLNLADQPKRFQTWLNTNVKADSTIAWMGFARKDGVILASYNGLLEGVNVSARPWFGAGLKGNTALDMHEAVLLSKLLPTRKDGPWRFIDMTSPVFNEKNELTGVLGLHLSSDWLRENLQRIQQQMSAQRPMELIILGKDDQIRFSAAALPAGLNTLESVRRAHKGESGWIKETWPDGRVYLVGYAPSVGAAPFSGFGWISLVRVPIEQVMDDSRASRLLLFGTLLVSLLGCYAFTFWALSVVGKPVKRLMSGLENAESQGIQTEVITAVPSDFSALALTINKLVQKLKRREVLLESALQELQQSFQGVTDSFPGVLFRVVHSPTGPVFDYLSASAKTYFGMEVSNHTAFEQLYARVHEADRVGFRMLQDHLAQSDAKTQITLRLIGADQKVRWMQLKLQARPSQQSPGTSVWDGIATDVSDLVKARSDAEAADQAKSRFLATMSHEIRTPLNGIIGMSRSLESDLSDPTHRQEARIVRETAETLTRILNDVLDFSKIEEDQLTFEKRPFELEDVVRSCARLYESNAQAKHLGWEVDLSGVAPVSVMGDPVRLRQVIQNLLSNAIKFTESGQVKLAARLKPRSDGMADIAVEISDTGIGMTPEQQSQLFKRFVQAQDSTYRRFGGSGLGLAISKGIVEGMGGRIQVQSTPDVGSRFIVQVELPLAEHDAPNAVEQIAQLEPMRILVVDDVALNRTILRKLLERRNQLVTEAESGPAGLAHLASGTFDLVFMDIDMPGMSGYETAQRVRRTKGPNQGIPIVAMTGLAGAQDIENAKAAGMDHHIAKPIQWESVAQVLLRYGTLGERSQAPES